MIAWAIAGIVGSATIGGGWYVNDYVHERLATKDEVLVAGTKADYALDKQMEALLAKINALASKKHKTADDIQQLEYLRQELERTRQMRRGK
jgi:hypothetical protein